MTHPPLVIIIATCGRHTLLDRLLDTLAACAIPPNPTRVLIAENGPTIADRPPLRDRAGSYPITHRHTREPNKSFALNHALAAADPQEFAVFFDDDVRVHSQTLMAYSEAIRDRPHFAFFGGQCLVDYDAPPARWLLPYLPASAKGWSLGRDTVPFDQPHALGFNWSARVEDLQRCGGFNPDRGPGTTICIGEESDVQQRLMADGVRGYYVPNATVSHYVPAQRCSPRWALERALQNGFVRGLNYPSGLGTPRQVSYRYRIKFIRAAVMAAWSRRCATPEKQFHHEYWKQRHSGMLAGLRVAACRQSAQNAHAA